MQAIVDGCPHLESLDTHRGFNVRLHGSIRATCLEKIKELRLPGDPTDGSLSNSVGEADGYESIDDRYDYDFDQWHICCFSGHDYHYFEDLHLPV
ncbi:putative F-box/LRR-repeat protein 22 [Acorus calamus]|uniref:F-box/LRR-repeat protein 22 n=1 Tax=Acorus calamus TaxID=4465 RepID=A0AAV9E5A1_ACOCL|nr:putative F-box/LRR-repeat protein 22 [Acorus calamus]